MCPEKNFWILPVCYSLMEWDRKMHYNASDSNWLHWQLVIQRSYWQWQSNKKWLHSIVIHGKFFSYLELQQVEWASESSYFHWSQEVAVTCQLTAMKMKKLLMIDPDDTAELIFLCAGSLHSLFCSKFFEWLCWCIGHLCHVFYLCYLCHLCIAFIHWSSDMYPYFYEL